MGESPPKNGWATRSWVLMTGIGAIAALVPMLVGITWLFATRLSDDFDRRFDKLESQIERIEDKYHGNC